MAVMIEIKAKTSADAEDMKKYVEEDAGITLHWQPQKSDFFSGTQSEYFKAFAPYIKEQPESILRVYVKSVLYNRVMNGIYHFHQKTGKDILTLGHYQNGDGEGWLNCVRFSNGKGKEIAVKKSGRMIV